MVLYGITVQSQNMKEISFGKLELIQKLASFEIAALFPLPIDKRQGREFQN